MLSILKRNSSSCVETLQKISEIDLVGRDLVDPKCFTPTEIKSVLWTALDLKHRSNSEECNKVPSMKNTRVSLILDHPDAKSQFPLTVASSLLHTSSLNMIIDSKWKKDNPFVCDFGRMLSLNSSIVFCEIKEQKFIEQLADGSNIPVVGIGSNEYSIVKTLADVMTCYERFCRLKYLTWAWVGTADPLFNTYLMMFPQLKMNIKYCLVDAVCHRLKLDEAYRNSQRNNTQIHEYWTAQEAIYRSDMISTCSHSNCDFTISMDDMKEAAIKWGFVHKLPRGDFEVSRSVFTHKKCSLVWKSIENLQWIYAALIVRLLKKYNHVIPEPKFDADEF